MYVELWVLHVSRVRGVTASEQHAFGKEELDRSCPFTKLK